MTSLRRLAAVALGVALLHVAFGVVVRVTGSGAGCGADWPKCRGAWFPPLDRPDLVIDLAHRWLALLLLAAIVTLVVATVRRRRVPGVGGPGGLVRPALGALVTVVATALFGAGTTRLGAPAWAPVVYWGLTLTLLLQLAIVVLRARGAGAAPAWAAR